MNTKPRLVLDQLIAAFENHYEVASSDQVDEQALIDAEEALRDAFFSRSSKLSFLSTSSFRMRKTRKKTLTTTMKMMKKSMMMTMDLSILMRMKTKTSRSSCL